MKELVTNRWLLLCSILLLLLVLADCGKKKIVMTAPDLVRQHEQLIDTMNRSGDAGQYAVALASCNDFLQRYPQSPVLDHALFVCGVLSASEQNPGKNYPEALGYLDRLIRQVPTSGYLPGARLVSQLINAVVLGTATGLKKSDIIRDLQALQAQQLKTLQELQRKVAQSKATDLKQAETIRDLQALQAQQLKTIQELQREIEKIKKIDLNKRP
jgi:hypothetical protein